MKKWNKPELSNLEIIDTLARPEDKCTNNNGNGKNCVRNPNGLTYEGDMFLCYYYIKQGHQCTSPHADVSGS